jgi:hypothetical protein
MVAKLKSFVLKSALKLRKLFSSNTDEADEHTQLFF